MNNNFGKKNYLIIGNKNKKFEKKLSFNLFDLYSFFI